MSSEHDAIEQEVVAWIDNHEYLAAYPSLSACLDDQIQGQTQQMATRIRALERVAEELLDLGAHVTFGVPPPGWHQLLHKAAVALRKMDH